MRATLTTTKSLLGTRTMNLRNTEDEFFFCAYSVVMVIFLGRVCHSLGFLFSFFFCYSAFYSPSVMLHLYLQLGTIHTFIFVSHQLYFDTGNAIAKILLTTQCFLVPSVPSLPHSCVAMVWLTGHLSPSLLPIRIQKKKFHCCCFNTY